MTPPDPRLAHWLADAPLTDGTRVALVGFPSDAGVRRNGGRPGAADGPAAIRAALLRMTPDAQDPEPFVRLLDRTADLGDVPVTGDVEADQLRLGETLAPLLARSAPERAVVPIVLGGGHETAFGHFLGHVGAGRRVRALNWDAHADVRPLLDGTPQGGGGRAHSGSPFRQMIEHPSGACAGYTAAGLLPWRVAAEHAAWVRARGGEIVWRDELSPARARALVAALDGPALASFDLDAVDGAAGVSAPGVGGLDVATWLAAAEACGAAPHVASLDVVELSPRHDPGGRSATLAALTVWHMLRGLARRLGG